MNKFLSIVIVFLVVNTYAQQQFSVDFDSNKYETNATETKKLQRWIYENPSVKIVAINGYTDEDGTNVFNDSLAKKRVDFIFKLVKDKIKIREDFKTRSFGENLKQSTWRAASPWREIRIARGPCNASPATRCPGDRTGAGEAVLGHVSRC